MDWYPHSEIEKKWQERWKKSALPAEDFSKQKKFYLLFEFPYPSGDGLHVGHLRSYTALDVIARKLRMQGKNVLFPIGWDAFGLPTENYALKTGIHPRKATDQNIATFKRQMQSLGLSLDWSREIDTTDPQYYRWTQWIFLQFFKRGLAYQATIPINWCPKDKIGLANEEVIGGKCERCGTEVIRKEQKQWLLKITAYADRLIDDLKLVDFPERVKTSQINWIGKSEGAEIDFAIAPQGNFVLLHGFQGGPEVNFFPWAKRHLEQHSVRVDIPALPDPDNPSVPEQIQYVQEHCTFTPQTTLLGRSLGTVIALKVVEQLKQPIRKLILVAGFASPKFKDHPRPFENTFDWKFDWEKIRRNVGEVVLLHDINDPAVSDERAAELEKNLDIQAIRVAAREPHFDAEQEPVVLDQLLPRVKVFTTRPDTVFGATYLVLSPEHEAIQNSKLRMKNWDEVQAYVERSRKKSDLERTDLAKEKTGVELKGITAINPANGEEIPIWVADYVLPHYGTGAVMAVPAHDERDWEFAKKLGLPIREVIEPVFIDESSKPVEGKPFVERETIYAILRNPKDKTVLCLDWGKFGWRTFIIGGTDGEDPVEAAKREILEETGYLHIKHVQTLGRQTSKYYAAHKEENRTAHATVLVFDLHDEEKKDVQNKEKETHTPHWIPASEVESYLTPSSQKYAWKQCQEGERAYIGDGLLVNSGQFDGMEAVEAGKKITEWLAKQGVGRKAITYKLRDWVFSRQHYWGEPIPIIHCPEHGAVAVPEKDLPVELPHVEKYQPTETGKSPLENIPEFVNVQCPECGKEAKRETDTMPNWAGSSWYFYRYCDPRNDRGFAEFKKLGYWMPVDLYNGGMEHTTLHLLYSRFWHKFLFDQELVPEPEPYKKRVSHGIILGEDSRKMSKSFGNVVNPDDLVREYGADSVRTYEMFIGPYQDMIPWSTRGLIGVHRFLQSVYDLFSAKASTEQQGDDSDIERLLHATIKGVTEDVDAMRFNTAVSKLMILANALRSASSGTAVEEAKKTLLLLLYPFAPHVASELWEKTYGGDVCKQSWPAFDESKLKQSRITLVVQVNGKVRAKIQASPGVTKEEAVQMALSEPNVSKYVSGEPKRVVFVPGRLINLTL